ncbi:MAG: hypothetical protein ACRDN6_10265 [Gaiellaceae bacterium]
MAVMVFLATSLAFVSAGRSGPVVVQGIQQQTGDTAQASVRTR